MVKRIEEIKVKNPKSLRLYGKCMELNKLIYQLAKQFPQIEVRNAKSQIIRSATSIGANLSEGNGQIYIAKELSFLNNSLGSAQETLYWIELSRINNYISKDQFENANQLTQEIIRMLVTLMKRLNSGNIA